MKTIYQTSANYLLIFVFSIFSGPKLIAQYCDSLVPTFVVDLSASPNYNWLSTPVIRDGNCCGTSSPDNCLEFVITLHPDAIAVTFNIASGAVPPGALFYQIDCGPMTAVGEPICLEGIGPHHLTFCKPGNNANTFSIVSYSSPEIGPDITLNAGCQGFIYGNYYDETTVSWTSIAPGIVGQYDYLLSCNLGCDTTFVTAPAVGPSYVDYLVCGMDVGGCDSLPICDTIRVHFIEPVEVDITATAIFLCAGETTSLTAGAFGGSAPYSYLWNTGEATHTISVVPGTYIVEVLDSSACITATDTITIYQYAPSVVNAGPDLAICEGEIITLYGTGAVSYVWDNFVIDGIPFVQAVGSITYTLIGIDANGCSSSDQVNVLVNPTPIVNAGTDQTVCFGTSAVLNGSGALSYVWNNGISDGVAFIPAVGSTLYVVEGSDVNGCIDLDEVWINVNPIPVVSGGPDVVVCEGTEITLNASGAESYMWDNGVFDGAPFIPTVGITFYNVMGTDINGCVDSDQVMVTVNSLPLVIVGPNITVCDGEQITLTATGASSYLWDHGVVNGVPFYASVGTTLYNVLGTDLNGCVDTDQLFVTVNPLPVVDAGPDQIGCEGLTVTLNGSGASGYLWDNGAVNGVSFQPTIGAINYVLIGTDINGCSSSDSVNVIVNESPIVTAIDVIICDGESVVLLASGASTYTWSDGVENGVPFFPSESKFYVVTGTNDFGCSASDTVSVIVKPSPIAAFQILNMDLTTSNSTTGFNNQSVGATSYQWDFGDGTPLSAEFEPTHTFPYDQSGEYEITLTAFSAEGCPSQAIKYVHVFRDYIIYVPNAFTPDGDAMNQVFKPIMEGFDEDEYTLYIFNRWGQLVFESHNLEVGWDGTFAGQDFRSQDGVYTWKIMAGIKDSADSKIFIGHVSLLK